MRKGRANGEELAGRIAFILDPPLDQTNLLTLSPQLQEAHPLGDLHFSERRIRALGAGAEWWTIGDIGNTLFLGHG